MLINDGGPHVWWMILANRMQTSRRPATGNNRRRALSRSHTTSNRLSVNARAYYSRISSHRCLKSWLFHVAQCRPWKRCDIRMIIYATPRLFLVSSCSPRCTGRGILSRCAMQALASHIQLLDYDCCRDYREQILLVIGQCDEDANLLTLALIYMLRRLTTEVYVTIAVMSNGVRVSVYNPSDL